MMKCYHLWLRQQTCVFSQSELWGVHGQGAGVSCEAFSSGAADRYLLAGSSQPFLCVWMNIPGVPCCYYKDSNHMILEPPWSHVA
jgi:hypothetical protein